jgi:hypothetical protein
VAQSFWYAKGGNVKPKALSGFCKKSLLLLLLLLLGAIRLRYFRASALANVPKEWL